jgi:hypothetical protein
MNMIKTSTINVLQDNFTLFHDHLKRGKMNLYVNWGFLSLVFLYIIRYSVNTHWCRPMFWLVLFCVIANEYSECLYLEKGTYYSKMLLDTSFRLAASLFGVGVFYSLFQRFRARMTIVHVNYILYALSHLLLGIYTIEFIALFQTLSTNTCHWFYPIVSWSSASLVLFGIVASIMLKVQSCGNWVKQKSFWLVAAIWGICTYYVHWYFESHCTHLFNDINSTTTNIFSWFFIVVYMLWDKFIKS